VQGRTVSVIEPVSGIKRQQIYFSPFWQIGRLINDKSTFSDMCFDDHEGECNTGRTDQQDAQPSPYSARNPVTVTERKGRLRKNSRIQMVDEIPFQL
jgi:hypothetical protein